MVEPLAAVVLNSLLPSCSTLRYSLFLQPVARASKGSPRMSFTPDFFTSQLRRGKGKEKAQINLTQEWSSCANKHSLWCPRTFIFASFTPLLYLLSYQTKTALL